MSNPTPHPLHLERHGSGFPILCLHGHPGSGAAMAVFTEPLSSQYRTLAPDLRGYGHSQTQDPFEMAAHITDLEALLDREGIDQCLILGWSLGGILAMELALRNPQRYRGLILIGTAARPRGNYPPIPWWEYVNTGIAGLINRIKPGWQWNIDTFGTRSLFRRLLKQHTPTAYHYLAQAGTPAYLRTSRHAHRALNTALRQGYNRLADLPTLTMPCLMVAGADDINITAQSSQETAQALPRCAWHCFPNTAHLFPWEVSNAMNETIHAWLRQQDL
ncbi:alpha/beta hydrolase [Spirulina major CS-329]|uniref:alpha/beta fold hydrolase n=1 Tax=Spirulina TaxID=1154 RepID=UPI00232E2ECE|nr:MULTISPECIES: alpha/beta hydrolase [Spirulina]MDB9494148.1 alpha/beta hydrolase [Spirulina subsalsa CS-330]MDB9504795.1 alpha/beta hydrolase [Spirulina major CS-329]